MIKLITKYPYDDSYDIVKFFANRTEQKNFFENFSYTFIEEHNYVRINENTIRVPYNFEYISDSGINYMILNNSGKDYYCFIESKNWISEEVTEIIYKIDVIQTFMFDFKCKDSFIERMHCSIDEISDFDEGLAFGEHKISSVVSNITKDYVYYAMFGGIKQECITIDDNGNVTSVNQLNTSINTPMTKIDNIDYPLYFVPLKDEYLEPALIQITSSANNTSSGTTGGDWEKGIVSREGFRFIKGMEGFGSKAYQDSGGYWTIGYGITQIGEPDIYNKLASMEVLEEEVVAREFYNLLNERYGAKIVEACKNLGVKKQYQFDALLSLAYNSGTGSVSGDNELTSAIKSGSPTIIRNVWENFKCTSNGIPLEGLKHLRKEQCNMFLGEEYDIRPIIYVPDYDKYVTENDGNGWLP